jgi:hypothetical protein
MMMPKLPDLESLLSDPPFEVPSDFESRVLNQIANLPPGKVRVIRSVSAIEPIVMRLRWFALVGSGLLTAAELFTFVFGLWSATNAF